ncbi:MAG: MFS transporter [Alphaproteobacteria bacterium]|nr:MFS transporter [Alphaproteobacteria bacterium]
MTVTRWADLFREGRAVYTVSLALGILLHAIDAFVLSTVMPTVVAEIGGAAYYSWGVMLYMTASILGAATGGPVKIRLGARRGYSAAGCVFLCGTVIAGSADSMGVLLAGRLIGGFGAGLIVSQNVALISELFPGALRLRMIAVTSLMWASSAVLGPAIGGIFAELAWWRGAFWFQVPVILYFICSAWLRLPDSMPTPEQRARRFPLGRVALLGAGVLTVGATSNVDQLAQAVASWFGHADGEAALHGAAAQGVALVVGFGLVWLTLRLDARAKQNRVFPTAPFSLANPVGTAYWAFLLVGMAPVAAGIFMPLTYQVIYGLPPIVAGYLSSIMAVLWSIGSTLSAGMTLERQRVALIVGPLLAVIGVSGIGIGVGDWQWPYLVVFTCLTGLGVGLCVPHLMNWTMGFARKGEETITASSIHTIRSLGIAFGAAGAGIIANQAGLGGGISVANVARSVSWVQGIAALAPLVAVILGVHLIGHRRRRDADALAAAE